MPGSACNITSDESPFRLLFWDSMSAEWARCLVRNASVIAHEGMPRWRGEAGGWAVPPGTDSLNMWGSGTAHARPLVRERSPRPTHHAPATDTVD